MKNHWISGLQYSNMGEIPNTPVVCDIGQTLLDSVASTNLGHKFAEAGHPIMKDTSNFTNQKERKLVSVMGSSAKSIASQKSKESMNSNQSVKVRAARLAKMRIEGVIEKKMRLASMLNRRAFLRRFGSSKSMEATLDSMEMELDEFEKAIGRDILGPPENDDDGKKSLFSFDLAGGNKKTTYDMNTHDAQSEQGENQEVRRRSEQASSVVNRRLIDFSMFCCCQTMSTQSKSSRTIGSMSRGDRSATTRKASNVISDLPEASNLVFDLPKVDVDVKEVVDEDVEDRASDSDSSVSEGEESVEVVSPQVEYQESNTKINTSGPFQWFDRIVREGDFCIDYACRMIECDPTETYAQTRTALAEITTLEVTTEEKEIDVVKHTEEDKPGNDKPKKRKSWFRVPGLKKGNTTIELKNADPALDDLTDSDSWQSEDEDPVDFDDSKLLSKSPEEYFAIIAAKNKSSNRGGDKGKEEVNNIEHDGRVMCEV